MVWRHSVLRFSCSVCFAVIAALHHHSPTPPPLDSSGSSQAVLGQHFSFVGVSPLCSLLQLLCVESSCIEALHHHSPTLPPPVTTHLARLKLGVAVLGQHFFVCWCRAARSKVTEMWAQHLVRLMGALPELDLCVEAATGADEHGLREVWIDFFEQFLRALHRALPNVRGRELEGLNMV
jgi:hypothetical protein